jgi:hypothetical protein
VRTPEGYEVDFLARAPDGIEHLRSRCTRTRATLRRRSGKSVPFGKRDGGEEKHGDGYSRSRETACHRHRRRISPARRPISGCSPGKRLRHERRCD